MGGSRRGGGWRLWRFLYDTFWCSISRQRIFFLYGDTCLWFRGCPVLLDVELPVSARYQKTRVLLRTRRLMLLLVAAASGGVSHKFQNYVQSV